MDTTGRNSPDWRHWVFLVVVFLILGVVLYYALNLLWGLIVFVVVALLAWWAIKRLAHWKERHPPPRL